MPSVCFHIDEVESPPSRAERLSREQAKHTTPVAFGTQPDVVLEVLDFLDPSLKSTAEKALSDNVFFVKPRKASDFYTSDMARLIFEDVSRAWRDKGLEFLDAADHAA